MRFSYGNISLSYVNENMYLLGNMPFFKIHVNIFMARIVLWPEMIPLVDDSIPFEMILRQNEYCRRGAWCNFRSLEVFLLSDSVQFSSVGQSCPTLCDPMKCSMPDLPAHHQLPESTQTHVHWVVDAIQPSHPLWFPSPALNLSQHQGLFQWVSSSHQVAKVLEFSFNISSSNEHQDWSPLGWTGWISQQQAHRYKMPCYKLARVTISVPFWCLCKKLSLSLWYFNKTVLHKSSEWSSLDSGPELNSSPLEAKHPSTIHCSQLQPLSGKKIHRQFRRHRFEL